MELEPEPEQRQLCQGCQRPPIVCICSSLPARPVELRRCRVLLLQRLLTHGQRSERRQPRPRVLAADPDAQPLLITQVRKVGTPYIVTKVSERACS